MKKQATKTRSASTKKSAQKRRAPLAKAPTRKVAKKVTKRTGKRPTKKTATKPPVPASIRAAAKRANPKAKKRPVQSAVRTRSPWPPQQQPSIEITDFVTDPMPAKANSPCQVTLTVDGLPTQFDVAFARAGDPMPTAVPRSEIVSRTTTGVVILHTFEVAGIYSVYAGKLSSDWGSIDGLQVRR